MASRSEKTGAAAVHLLTASGAAWGMLALVAIADGRFKAALAWMVLALLVDSVDGTLARRFRVREVLPQIDGALLDNTVDYLNYVVVPAWFVYEAGLLPEGFGVAGATAICLASAFQFSHAEAKTPDHFFRGFPSYWNVAVWYFLLLDLPPRVNLAIVAVLVILVFVPVYFVYPSRTPAFRRTTLLLTGVWGLLLASLIARYPDHSPWPTRLSLLYVAYYFLLSGSLTAARVRRRSSDRPLSR
jgi:phosphatidylcholine synthase